jgi:hypothetical protein
MPNFMNVSPDGSWFFWQCILDWPQVQRLPIPHGGRRLAQVAPMVSFGVSFGITFSWGESRP